ncbi:MAG TPA: zinc-ribbon domain-containing protein [Anaerolineaceae bacterium]|nr:zinc-ribbon domain-containing protein [Anaerolineaceae bacterium]
MSDFFGKIKSGAGKVTFEADKLNRLNRAKGDLDKIKSQIQAQYSKLGELYYTQRASQGVSGPAYDQICQAIADLEHQAEYKNEEIQRINAEAFPAQGAITQPVSGPSQPAATPVPPQYVPPAAPAAPAAAAPAAAATKFCTNCGREMAVDVKFCPDCGTKV